MSTPSPRMQRLMPHLIRAGIAAVLFLLPIAVASLARAEDGGHLAAAARLLNSGETAEATRLLAGRVAVRRDDLAAQTYLAVALDRLAQQGDAEALEGVRQVLPDWPPVLERLGRIYDDRGRHADAAGVYKAWIRLRPGNPEPYARLAEHEAQVGHYPKAIALLERHRVLVGGESDYAARRIEELRAAMTDRTATWPPAPQAGAAVARAR